MKDLKCGLKSCRYNKGYSCCSDEISVDSGTDCRTFSPDPNKRGNLFEAGEEFVPADYSVDTAVACTAECVFNKQEKCVANGITVMSEGEQDAVCLTFMRR
ncbi:MAG: DUF1540 domain-containing protein [Clostridiales bacterium]|jgi:hypothetical protein|nr:DUF1540 domain-containing protein [Clostridiales bacterium]